MFRVLQYLTGAIVAPIVFITVLFSLCLLLCVPPSKGAVCSMSFNVDSSNPVVPMGVYQNTVVKSPLLIPCRSLVILGPSLRYHKDPAFPFLQWIEFNRASNPSVPCGLELHWCFELNEIDPQRNCNLRCAKTIT